MQLRCECQASTRSREPTPAHHLPAVASRAHFTLRQSAQLQELEGQHLLPLFSPSHIDARQPPEQASLLCRPWPLWRLCQSLARRSGRISKSTGKRCVWVRSHHIHRACSKGAVLVTLWLSHRSEPEWDGLTHSLKLSANAQLLTFIKLPPYLHHKVKCFQGIQRSFPSKSSFLWFTHQEDKTKIILFKSRTEEGRVACSCAVLTRYGLEIDPQVGGRKERRVIIQWGQRFSLERWKSSGDGWMDDGDCCTTTCMYLMPQNYTLT